MDFHSTFFCLLVKHLTKLSQTCTESVVMGHLFRKTKIYLEQISKYNIT